MHGFRTYLKYSVKLSLVLLIILFSKHAGAQDLPEIPPLIVVTVDHSDNGVVIQWDPSPDTGIVSYNVYTRNPDNSFNLVVSLPSTDLQYKDLVFRPDNPAYSVTAVNNAIPPSESVFENNVQRAVKLSTEFDLCTQSNILNWTAYEGWEGNISGYKVYGGRMGDPLVQLSLEPSAVHSFSHSVTDINTNYIYYIETINSSGITSLSALDTVYTLYPEAPSYVYIDHVSVLDESSVEIQFSADIAGPVTSFRLFRRSNPSTPFQAVETFWNISEPTQVVQDAAITGSNSYQYKLESVFLPASCASAIKISESNLGTSVLLLSELNDQTVTLNWTPYENYVSGLAGYTVQRMDENGEFADVATLGPLSTQWQESVQFPINGFQSGEVYYRVIAISNPSGGGTEEQSISNITSVQLETHMQVPNAFTPGSNDINAEFKPLMDFAPREYLMIVVDRGGRKMFETTDPNEGWDGRFQGGSYVDEAVYVFHIQYTDFTGLFKTFTGNVTVLYP